MHLIVDNSAAPLPPRPQPPLAGAFTERRSSPAFARLTRRLADTYGTALTAARHDGYWAGWQAGWCRGWYWGLAWGAGLGGAIVALAWLAGRHAA